MTPFFTPWKIVTLSTPKEKSLFARFVSLKPPNSIRLFTMKEVKLSEVVPSTTCCKFSIIKTFFLSFITYTWTDNHDWLLMVVTSSQFIEIRGDFCTTTFVVRKITLCITSTMVQLVELDQCLWGQFSTFKNLKSPFNLSKSIMGRPCLRRCQIARNWMYFFSSLPCPHSQIEQQPCPNLWQQTTSHFSHVN